MYQDEEKKKKTDIMTRNKNHLEHVKKQMQQSPNKMFAKTGVAIIKNKG